MAGAKADAEKQRVTAIVAGLRREYADAECALRHADPFQLLIATILSAQCTDERVNQVTPSLFARYPTAGDLARVPLATLEQAIQPTGFFRNKARNIQGCCRRLVDEHGGEVPRDLAALVELPGVGRKTANVVLGNAFGIPGITPDTHLIRLSNRFGWVRSTKPDDVERAVGALFPPGEWVMVCHRVIWHGRRCCHARRPACGACPVAGICPSHDIGEQDPVKAAALIREPRG